MCVRVHMSVNVCVSVFISMYMCACLCVCMCVYVHVHVRMSVYVCVSVEDREGIRPPTTGVQVSSYEVPYMGTGSQVQIFNNSHKFS